MKYAAMILVGMTMAAPVHAQEENPLDAEVVTDSVGQNPSVIYLMKQYNLSAEEATRRIDLQGDIVAMSERLNRDNDPAYADMYIQHEPVYKIIVRFADKKDRTAFLDQLDPKLQRYVQLKNATRSRVRINQELGTLATAINAAGIEYSGGFDLENTRYEVIVANQSDADTISTLVPASLKKDVDVKVGIVPVSEAAPYGVKAGDVIRGGYTIRKAANSTAPRCTLGYNVTYKSGTTTKRGVVTAGHCDNTMYFSVGGHWVTLHSPVIERDPDVHNNAKYDYQVWETTGLASNNDVYFRDLENIPEFPSSGTFDLTSITTFMNQKKGMVVCKSGAVTGITCGQIIDGNAYRNGAYGWIKVSKTYQSDLSKPGDSGGPWFIYPNSSTSISGTGIHAAGGLNDSGYNAVSVYMPIDYINDHLSSVSTVKN